MHWSRSMVSRALRSPAASTAMSCDGPKGCTFRGNHPLASRPRDPDRSGRAGRRRAGRAHPRSASAGIRKLLRGAGAVLPPPLPFSHRKGRFWRSSPITRQSLPTARRSSPLGRRSSPAARRSPAPPRSGPLSLASPMVKPYRTTFLHRRTSAPESSRELFPSDLQGVAP